MCMLILAACMALLRAYVHIYNVAVSCNVCESIGIWMCVVLYVCVCVTVSLSGMVWASWVDSYSGGSSQDGGCVPGTR